MKLKARAVDAAWAFFVKEGLKVEKSQGRKVRVCQFLCWVNVFEIA